MIAKKYTRKSEPVNEVLEVLLDAGAIHDFEELISLGAPGFSEIPDPDMVKLLYRAGLNCKKLKRERWTKIKDSVFQTHLSDCLKLKFLLENSSGQNVIQYLPQGLQREIIEYI